MKKRIIKGIYRKVIAAATGAAVLVSAYAPTLASAAAPEEYISDVYLSYGDTADKAKQWLKDNGYTVLDQDLNEGAAGGISWLGISFSKERCVYLGYKTTTDKSKAIRDMRAMNMNGDYSYDEYEKLLETRKSEINAFISSVKTALSEYRENYRKGAVKAQISHDRMNKVLDDDSGHGGLGDLLLGPIREEMSGEDYEKEKTKHVDMTTFLMQGNIGSVNAVMNDLCLAADTSENGWLYRLGNSGGIDGLISRYEKEYPDLSESKLLSFIRSDYDDEAKLLAEKLADLRGSLKIYTESPVKNSTDEEEVKKYFEENKDINSSDWAMAASQYALLSGTEYEEGTLYDLLDTEKFDFANKDDRMVLYPLLESMSAGQRALLSYVDIGNLFVAGDLNNEGWQETQNKVNALIKDSAPNSAYAGVDRSVFRPGGIALTSEARQIQSATGSTYANEIFGMDATAVQIAGYVTGFVFIVAGACTIRYGYGSVRELAEYRVIDKTVEKAIANAKEASAKLTEELEKFGKPLVEYMKSNDIDILGGYPLEYIEDHYSAMLTVLNKAENDNSKVFISYTSGKKNRFLSVEELVNEIAGKNEENAGNGYDKVYELCKEYRETELEGSANKTAERIELVEEFVPRSAGWKIAGTIVCVAGALIALGTAAVSIYEAYKYYHQELQPIPDRIVHESTDDKGRFVYTVYNCTLCNRSEKGFGNDKLGDNGDMHGDVCKQWLALYTTKDEAAGDPITSDMITQTGSNKFPADKGTTVRLFGQTDSVNIVSTDYCYNDKFGGLYIFSGTENAEEKPAETPEESTPDTSSSAEKSSEAESTAETTSEAAAPAEDSSSKADAPAAGSVVGTGVMVGSCVGSAVLGVLVCFLIVRLRRKESAA